MRVSDPLEPELQTVVSSHVDIGNQVLWKISQCKRKEERGGEREGGREGGRKEKERQKTRSLTEPRAHYSSWTGCPASPQDASVSFPWVWGYKPGLHCHAQLLELNLQTRLASNSPRSTLPLPPECWD
jgi:hypothetical protein